MCKYCQNGDLKQKTNYATYFSKYLENRPKNSSKYVQFTTFLIS